MEQYSTLSRAQLSFEYLHTNSTTHEFLFGAIAELIDNSRDAGATELDIYTILDESLRGGYMLCFLDNGCGMSSDETRNVIIFGKSVKKVEESTSIGMYGNGLKSGSMRIGNDMILFTKKDGILTCLFLSRTFHEEEKIDEVVVPLPAFRATDHSPLADNNDDRKRHELEVALVLKYSPFKCLKDLFAQFDKIKGSTGTLCIIYNMKLLDNGEAELDVFSDSRDIILTHPDLEDNAGVDVDVELCPERRSLRAYVSILYSDPRMKVYLQGRKVQTKRLVSYLYKPRMYHYMSKTFKTRAEGEVAKAKEEVRIAEMKAREAESKARDMEARYGNSVDAEQLKMLRKIKNKALETREIVKIKQNAHARKQRALKEPKTLTFYFGINLENRACDGMFVFNCSRLIKMYQRIGPQQDSGMTCRGVVGIVNVPYLVLEPTHNKQDFADAKEFRALMRAMADHLMQYWDDIEMDKRGVEMMWAKYGYQSAKWRDPPLIEDKYVRRRALSISLSVQCDQCLKWRVLPFQQNLIGKELPDNWQCKDNPDPKHKKCSEPEQQLNIPVDTLKRKIKTKEQRQVELEEQIRRKQEELERITGQDKKSKKGKLVISSDEEEEEEEEEEAEDSDVELADRPSRKVKTVAKRAIQNQTNELLKKAAPTAASAPSVPSASVNNESTIARKGKSGGLTPSIALQNKNLRPHQVTMPAEKSAVRETVSSVSRKTKCEIRDPPPAKVAKISNESSKNPFASKPLPVSKIELKSHLKTDSAEASGEADTRKTRGSAAVAVAMSPPVTPVVLNGASSPAEGEPGVIKAEPTEESTAQTRSIYDSASMLDVQVRHNNKWVNARVAECALNEWKVHLDGSADDGGEDGAVGLLTFPLTSGDIRHRSAPVLATTEKVFENLKVCLRYFLPPEWPVDKEAIHAFTARDLADFPLEKFFDKYEQGLRKLFTNFQAETQQSKEKLANLRKNVVKTLQLVDKDTKGLSSLTEEDIDRHLRDYLDSHI